MLVLWYNLIIIEKETGILKRKVIGLVGAVTLFVGTSSLVQAREVNISSNDRSTSNIPQSLYQSVKAFNMIINGDFSNGLYGWFDLGYGDVKVIEDPDSNYVELTNSEDPLEHGAQISQNFNPLIYGKKYELKFEYKGQSRVKITGYDGNTHQTDVNEELPPTQTWTEYSKVFTADIHDEDLQSSFLFFQNNSSESFPGQAVSIRHISLVEIN